MALSHYSIHSVPGCQLHVLDSSVKRRRASMAPSVGGAVPGRAMPPPSDESSCPWSFRSLTNSHWLFKLTQKSLPPGNLPRSLLQLRFLVWKGINPIKLGHGKREGYGCSSKERRKSKDKKRVSAESCWTWVEHWTSRLFLFRSRTEGYLCLLSCGCETPLLIQPSTVSVCLGVYIWGL